MPRCYLLALSAGSSLDQQSNNVSLFQLVEQVNVPPNAPPPPQGALPLEIHAYFNVLPEELGQSFEIRFALVANTGLETLSEPTNHRVTTQRYRTRTLGLPFPPVLGHYQVHVDFRLSGRDHWSRDPLSWPIHFVEIQDKPIVTH